MTTSAIERVLGGAAAITAAGGTTRLRASKRFWMVTCTTAAQTLALPPATVGGAYVFPGEPAKRFVIALKSTNSQSVTLKDSAGTTLAATLAAGEVWDVVLYSSATAAGSWFVHRRATSHVAGAGIPSTREFWPIALNDWSSVNFNGRAYLDANGYEGVNPVAITLTIGSGTYRGSDKIGDTTQDGSAIDTGIFPAGSRMLLLMSLSTISGFGGKAGRGGDVPPGLLAADGLPGGAALTCRIPTVIGGVGTIQGGGGGGAGGAYNGVASGGGGGGGAGFRWGLGGDPGGNGAVGGGGARGSQGAVFGGGAGGVGGSPSAGTGGAGGNPASAGANSGGTGGAAGKAIWYLTAAGAPTVGAGITVTGATTAF